MKPVCPTCGSAATETMTRFGPRHDCCGLWSWDFAPLVDKATHEARMMAHAAFDPLWRSGQMKRSFAYKALAKKMTLPRKDCHIKLMSAEVAARVPEYAAAIAKEFQFQRNGNAAGLMATHQTENGNGTGS